MARIHSRSAALATAFLTAALVAAVGVPGPVAVRAAAAPRVERMSGTDRYATAVAVSQATFQPGVATAFLATGEQFPDALAGTPAAGVARAPILLTTREALPEATEAELERLEPQRVVVLGGEGAVAPAVVDRLDEITPKVERISGSDRYATAARVSSAFFDPGVAVAYVTTGLGFSDALPAGAAGAGSHVRGPVLLTAPDALPAATAEELRRLDPGHIILLGGTAAVSDDVAQRLRDYAPRVTRVAGRDRHMTAALVARFSAPDGAETVYLATGAAFPDALAGGAVAGRSGAPLLLSERDCLPHPTAYELDRLAPERVVLLGGEGVLSAGVAALTPCAPPVAPDKVARDLFDRANTERTARDLPAYEWHDGLGAVAQESAEEWVSTGRAKTNRQILADPRVSCCVDHVSHYGALGLLLASGDVHATFVHLEGQGDARFLLQPGYQLSGVGVVCLDDGRLATVALYGRRRAAGTAVERGAPPVGAPVAAGAGVACPY